MPHTTYDDTRFLRETVVDVDAAVVGVSKARWEAIAEREASVEEAARRMQANRFDILPIYGWRLRQRILPDGDLERFFGCLT